MDGGRRDSRSRLARCMRQAFAAAAMLVLFAFPGPDPAAADWSTDVLYFVLIDRFADGDLTNDQRVERRNPGGYHGGDLKGLTDRLDELADLGVTALWINPVQKQMPFGVPAQAPAKLGVGEFMHWGFHGYWIYDFEQMEPQFGDVDALKRLVDEAHKRGIKVLLDVVYNHAGYRSIYEDRKTAAGEAWLRSAEGDCEINAITCRVGGLPDFKTELPEVRNYLLDANLGLAAKAGVDGFRLDTYKHVESDFWLEHRRRTREQLGKDFFLLAEYWGGTASSLDPFFERDEIDAGFDFSFKGSCEGWVTGRGRTVAYAAYLRSRHRVRAGHLLAHYLSSHDEPMALGDLHGDKGAFRLCVAVQMTSLGMPVIYYGEEVARQGTEWPLNRNDMPWGARDQLPGKGVARDEAMRAYYKSLIRIRRAHPALARGDYTMLTKPDDRVLVYARHDPVTGDRALVLVNRDDAVAPVDVALPADWPGGASVDLLQAGVFKTEDGRLRVPMEPKSARIVVPEAAAGGR